MTSAIRFVGGPWHNRIESVELIPVVMIWMPNKNADQYFLCRFQSEFGTFYFQYIHSKLIHRNKADRSTWEERFPVWRIDTRKMDAKIRLRFQRKKPASEKHTDGEGRASEGRREGPPDPAVGKNGLCEGL